MTGLSRLIGTAGLAGMSIAAMAAGGNPGQQTIAARPATNVFRIAPVATLSNPWAMAFLPDATLIVTQKSGELKSVATDGRVATISGVPPVSFQGQNGLLDVAIHPDFASNRLLYLSFSEPGPNGSSGLAVGRGRYVNGVLTGFAVIWRDEDKVGAGYGQTAGRMAFAPDKTLFVSAGERQLFTPAQSLQSSQGKILHMTDAGAALADRPFPGGNGATTYIWTLGHRNPLGIAFDPQGRLWEHENGPQGGDELNLIERGKNYGWPVVSNGTNYGDAPGVDTIPDHDSRPDFAAPQAWWNPSVAPAGLMFYTGTRFPKFTGNAFMGALAGQSLIRVVFTGNRVTTVRYDMGARIREVEQAPDGAILVLEDGSAGRLLRLTPKG